MLRVIKNTARSSLKLQNALLKTMAGTGELWIRSRTGSLTKDRSYEICNSWAHYSLEEIGGTLHFTGAPVYTKPCLFVGNHMSYLDIPLLWALTDVCFVSKAEVGRWPLVGTSGRARGTIFLDRASHTSRKRTLEAIARAINEDGKRVAMFPEGTSSVAGKKWKYGAFKLAQQYKIPVQPFRLFYSPSRLSAFIDDDALVPNLWRLVSHGGFHASVKTFEPIEVTNAEKDCQRVQEMIQTSVSHCLEMEKKGCYDPLQENERDSETSALEAQES